MEPITGIGKRPREIRCAKARPGPARPQAHLCSAFALRSDAHHRRRSGRALGSRAPAGRRAGGGGSGARRRDGAAGAAAARALGLGPDAALQRPSLHARQACAASQAKQRRENRHEAHPSRPRSATRGTLSSLSLRACVRVCVLRSRPLHAARPSPRLPHAKAHTAGLVIRNRPPGAESSRAVRFSRCHSGRTVVAILTIAVRRAWGDGPASVLPQFR